MHGFRVIEKNRVIGLLQSKVSDIKLQNAKLLVQTKILHLEQNFLSRLCNSGCKLIITL